MEPLPPPLAFIVLLFAGWVNRQQQAVIDYLLEENRVLRTAHGHRRVRLTDDQRRVLAVKGKALGRRRLTGIAGIVTPDTILRWYRTLVAKKYDGSPTRRPGRPRTKADLAALVVRLASENPRWGYTRIRGGLKGLGHDVGRNTIKSILKDHGIEPAPDRGADMPWKTFLAAHWDALAAGRLLHGRGPDTARPRSLCRVLRHEAEDAPCGDRRDRAAAGRDLDDAGRSESHRRRRRLSERHPAHHPRSRSAVYRRFSTPAADSGVTPVVLPAWSPNLNAFAERFVGSAKSECLDRIVLLGEGHLRAAVDEFVRHYHEERPHQGLNNQLIAPKITAIGRGRVRCRERLGGVLKFYHREAA